MTKRIVTNQNQDGEWIAHIDDIEAKDDPSHPIGYGASKLEALADLGEQYLTLEKAAFLDVETAVERFVRAINPKRTVQ